MVWNILGLYGSQGAALSRSVHLYPDKTGIMYSLGLMAHLVSVMDTLSITNSDKLYSFPHNIGSNCVVGKPYHFWMSAYLSYRLREENYSFEESVGGPMNLSKLYEYYYQPNGRNVEGSRSHYLLKKKLNSVTLNSIRISHVLHATGAFFGACSSNIKCTKILNFDELFAKTINASKKAKFFIGRQWIVPSGRSLEFSNPSFRFMNLERISGGNFIQKYILRSF
jgi:hypothetical protein